MDSIRTTIPHSLQLAAWRPWARLMTIRDTEDGARHPLETRHRPTDPAAPASWPCRKRAAHRGIIIRRRPATAPSSIPMDGQRQATPISWESSGRRRLLPAIAIQRFIGVRPMRRRRTLERTGRMHLTIATCRRDIRRATMGTMHTTATWNSHMDRTETGHTAATSR